MEKAYKAMTAAGAANIVTGVIMIVAGVSAGIVTIVHGARLLKHKKEVIVCRLCGVYRLFPSVFRLVRKDRGDSHVSVQPGVIQGN